MQNGQKTAEILERRSDILMEKNAILAHYRGEWETKEDI